MRLTSLDPQPRSYAMGALVSDVSRVLYVSGQVPALADGTVPDGFAAQCRLAWQNVLAVLDSADMSIANLVKVTIFLSDRRYRTENSRIRHEILGDHCPALTVIITGIYDESWLLEIEAVAVD
jgi:2-iminobutanoate/2-iminopropanoate deaminase